MSPAGNQAVFACVFHLDTTFCAPALSKAMLFSFREHRTRFEVVLLGC